MAKIRKSIGAGAEGGKPGPSSVEKVAKDG